jgi:uncharacterized membrane protein
MSTRARIKGSHWSIWGRQLGRPNAPSLAVILLIASYALFFSAYTLAQHRAFATFGADLGNVDQAVWSTTQGRVLHYTNWPGQTIRFGDHFEPILILVSLSYLIYSGPETLLVLQSVVLALGAWPVYCLAGRRLESDWMGAAFALVYLLFPGLQAANVFDFHAVALAPTFLAWAFWSLEERRYRRFAVWGLLAMSCKEEMPLVVATMGLWLLARGRPTPLGRRLGVATVFFGVTWTALAFLVIIPSLNTLDAISPYLGRYDHLGRDFQEMLVNLVTHPRLYLSTLTEPLKIRYLVKLFFPTGYLALLAPQVILLAAPSFAVNLLSNRPHMIALEEFHYTAPIAPFVVIAGAYGLVVVVRWMGRVFRRVDRRFLLAVGGSYVLLLTLAYHRVNGLMPLAYHFFWPQFGEHERIGHRLIEQIPADAAVSAQNHLNPHLTQRARVYIFPRLEDAEYALVDVTTYPYVDPIEAFYTTVHDLLTDPNVGVVMATDGYILFQRRAGSAELPDTFFASPQPLGEAEQCVTSASFDLGPTLIDVSWSPGKGDTLFVETTWLRQTEQITDGQMLIELVRSPAEWAVEREQELLLSVGYPPQKWPLEHRVRDVIYLTLPPDAPTETLHIGLVYRSPDGLRLPVVLAEGGNWRVDESGAMLLVPLDTLTD